ncbi:MAG: hypothetical protein R3B93_00575 [Bacteroidia bacterium]
MAAGPAGQPDISGIDEGFSTYIRQYWKAQELGQPTKLSSHGMTVIFTITTSRTEQVTSLLLLCTTGFIIKFLW